MWQPSEETRKNKKIRIEHVLVCLSQSLLFQDMELRSNTYGFRLCFMPPERVAVKQKPENCQRSQANGGGERNVA